MSIVAVHGPYTFGSKGVVQNAGGTAYATVNPANGLIWTFQARDQSQAAANYDWTYTGGVGSPPSPINDTKVPVITFPSAGPYVVTLTLNGVAQAPITVNAVAGVGPREEMTMMEAPAEAPAEAASAPVEQPDAGFDPAAHTVTEVISYVEDNPDQRDAILLLEEQGKNRVTLIDHLESM
jgi:hypothetical protein